MKRFPFAICLISSSLQAPREIISEAWRAAIAAGVWLGVHREGPVMLRAQDILFEVQNEKTLMYDMMWYGWYDIKNARQCCILPTWKWISKMQT